MTERGYSLRLPEPIVVEHIKLGKKVSKIRRHVHSYYELYFLVEGNVDCFIDNRTYPIAPFDVVFLSPNKLHNTIVQEGCSYERILVYFDRDAIISESLLRKIDENNNVISLSSTASKTIYKLLNIMLQSANNNDEFRYAYLQALLNELIITILRNNTPKKKKASTDFNALLDYIKMNFKEDISLNSVAQQFHMNPSYLSKTFKENIGLTFVTYVNYQRIIYAQSLLTETNKPITDITFECGFDSNTHFGRVFKQLTGVSPSSYRKQMSNS